MVARFLGAFDITEKRRVALPHVSGHQRLAIDNRTQDIKLGASLLQNAVNQAIAVSHSASAKTSQSEENIVDIKMLISRSTPFRIPEIVARP